MANVATLGGHVEVGDRATLGGMAGVHQFTKIGAFAYVGGHSGITKDIPPYVIMAGTRNQMRVTGINKIGLKRLGYDRESIKKLEQAFKIIFRTPELILKEALDKALAEFPGCEPVLFLVQFIRSSERGIVRVWEDD